MVTLSMPCLTRPKLTPENMLQCISHIRVFVLPQHNMVCFPILVHVLFLHRKLIDIDLDTKSRTMGFPSLWKVFRNIYFICKLCILGCFHFLFNRKWDDLTIQKCFHLMFDMFHVRGEWLLEGSLNLIVTFLWKYVASCLIIFSRISPLLYWNRSRENLFYLEYNFFCAVDFRLKMFYLFWG